MTSKYWCSTKKNDITTEFIDYYVPNDFSNNNNFINYSQRHTIHIYVIIIIIIIKINILVISVSL